MATLSDIISTFDVTGKRFEWHDIVSALNELPDNERSKPESHYERTAFMLQPNDSDSIFGGYFGPHFTFADSNGTPFYCPALSESGILRGELSIATTMQTFIEHMLIACWMFAIMTFLAILLLPQSLLNGCLV